MTVGFVVVLRNVAQCAEAVGGLADALGDRKLELTEMILLIVVVGDVRMDP
jgi:hypothetical protein